MDAVARRYGITGPFGLYPAMTWSHKNHVRLLEGLAQLKARTGACPRLVCTGKQTDYWPVIQNKMKDLGLTGQVAFTGLISHDELRALYRLAQFVIIPTLFEAASAPLFEAWQERVPVACANITSLPEQAGQGALLFDPYAVPAIAAALQSMSTDDALRRTLVEEGTRRLAAFSWERTARAYRALYRRVAGRPLTEADQAALHGGSAIM
jgi:glycosyltransferase involved in cell wall biosynthesis